MIINEATLKKIDNVLNQTIDMPLNVASVPLETSEKVAKEIPGYNKYVAPVITKIKKNITADPSKQDITTNMKEWAAGMGLAGAAMQIPHVLNGDIGLTAAGSIALGNATKGALVGAGLTGGRDTLFKNVAIPAVVMGLTTPVINSIGSHVLGQDDIDFMPEARVGTSALIGGGLWALRNKGNKNKQWI